MVGGSLKNLQDLNNLTFDQSELHTAGRICDILYTPNNQNLRGVPYFLAGISPTHPFIGNAAGKDRWGTYQGKNLSQWAQIKSLRNAWAENEHVVVPFVSHTLGRMSGKSAATLCLIAWCQAERDAELFVEDWGMVQRPTTALERRWRRRSVLLADGMRA